MIEGQNSILVVAPHGGDNEELADAAEMFARGLGAFAVINRGWRVSNKVDPIRDLANCNDLRQLGEDVVREEFFNPILRSVARIKKRYGGRVLMVVMKQCKDQTRDDVREEIVDVIVGYGAGTPQRFSCSLRTKNAIVGCLAEEGFGVFEGEAGGPHSGGAKNNLNQLFTRMMPDPDVESIQMAIVKEMIEDKDLASMTVSGLIGAFDAFMAIEEDSQVGESHVGTV